MRKRIFLAATFVAGLALGDTLTLKSGRSVQGTYLGGDARTIRMAVGERVDSFDLTEVSKIQFGDQQATTAPAPPPPAPPAAPPPRANIMRPDRTYSNEAPPPKPAEAMVREIPSGTSIVIRMIDPVDSERDRIGQTFKASIDEPVYVNGDPVIPRGNDVIVKLVDDKESGKLTGRTELTLDIVSVQIDNRMVDIDTSEVKQQSGSRTSRTTKVVGGTAALGAIIGAIAGGGKGAAIGAASGAAVGAGAQVMTKGQKVKIPSETRLTFTLQQPVRP